MWVDRVLCSDVHYLRCRSDAWIVNFLLQFDVDLVDVVTMSSPTWTPDGTVLTTVGLGLKSDWQYQCAPNVAGGWTAYLELTEHISSKRKRIDFVNVCPQINQFVRIRLWAASHSLFHSISSSFATAKSTELTGMWDATSAGALWLL